MAFGFKGLSCKKEIKEISKNIYLYKYIAIFRDKTMDDDLMYIPNFEYHFCNFVKYILTLVV